MSTKKNPGLAAVRAGAEAAKANTPAVATDLPKRRPSQPDDVPMSIRLPKPMHKELRRLAFEQEISINSMILEGIRSFLRSKGLTVE